MAKKKSKTTVKKTRGRGGLIDWNTLDVRGIVPLGPDHMAGRIDVYGGDRENARGRVVMVRQVMEQAIRMNDPAVAVPQADWVLGRAADLIRDLTSKGKRPDAVGDMLEEIEEARWLLNVEQPDAEYPGSEEVSK